MTPNSKSKVKLSKRYEPFLYWWDITPRFAGSMGQYGTIEFAKKDSGERCAVPVATLKMFLTPERQTSRGTGNWGIKVLHNRPNELAFEPGNKRQAWLFLPVTWRQGSQGG